MFVSASQLQVETNTLVCIQAGNSIHFSFQVRQLDWVEQVWPLHLKILQTNPTNDLNKMMYPKVQKYALKNLNSGVCMML